MKSEEIYNAWKEQKSQVDIDQNFPDNVMNQIYTYEQAKGKPLFDVQWFVELISASPLAKTAMVAAGALAGLIRAAFMLYAAFGT